MSAALLILAAVLMVAALIAAGCALYTALTLRRLEREVRDALEQMVIHAEFRP